MILASSLLAALACSGDEPHENRGADRADPLAASRAVVDRRYSFLRHSGGQTHFQRVGPESGELVVLVPGATLPLAVWEPLVPLLVESGFQVLRYDLPGRGYSSPLARPAGLESDVEQIDALLHELAAERPVDLVGLASGALSAAAYASAHPERVRRMALIAPDGVATHLSFMGRLFLAPVVGDLVSATFADRILLARATRYSAREDVRGFVRELLLFALRGEHYRREVLAYARALPLHDAEAYYRRLAATGIAVQIVWGSEDRITPVEAAEPMRAIFGSDPVVVLAGVGHLPFVEEPSRVARLLTEHFRAHAVAKGRGGR